MIEFISAPHFTVGLTLGVIIGLVVAGVIVLLAAGPTDVQGGGY